MSFPNSSSLVAIRKFSIGFTVCRTGIKGAGRNGVGYCPFQGFCYDWEYSVVTRRTWPRTTRPGLRSSACTQHGTGRETWCWTRDKRVLWRLRSFYRDKKGLISCRDMVHCVVTWVFGWSGRLCRDMNYHVATGFLGKGVSLGRNREFSIVTETVWPCVTTRF